MPLKSVNAQKTFRLAMSIFPAYAAEIEDYGSDSAGQFSANLFRTRIADNRMSSDDYLDMYDADPAPFLALFHEACDPLSKATIAALAGRWDEDGEDENDRHVAGCRPVFWDEAAPMRQCLEQSGRDDISEIELLAVMLSGMVILSHARNGDSAEIAACFDGDDQMVSIDHLRDMERLDSRAEEDGNDDEDGTDWPDDYEELRFS